MSVSGFVMGQQPMDPFVTSFSMRQGVDARSSRASHMSTAECYSRTRDILNILIQRHT